MQGDTVRFFAAGGEIHQGQIIDAGDRTSLVELVDKTINLASGTRGEARIPTARFNGGESAQEKREDWENKDESWQPGMPLLAEMEAVYPADRAVQFSGRVYFSIDQILSSEDGRSDGFYRLGTDLVYENLFGRGGEFKIDAEVNRRSTNVNDQGGEHRSDFRLDRLSYVLGGTRFWEQRFEAGRFLQFGMPEFGLLDGMEVSQRLASGDRVGVGIGFMPEPDSDLESGHDFQISMFYQYVADPEERFTATAGYQKTWHNATVDRDLFVGKFRYLPVDGWDIYGTAFVDAYLQDGDDEKPLFEFTQLQLTATRQTPTESGLSYSYRHLLFPQIDRDEFRPVFEGQLEENYNERIAVSGWNRLESGNKTHWQTGFWIDEDQAGGDAQYGIEQQEWLAEDTVTDSTVFFTMGQFVRLMGARFNHAWLTDFGRWDLFYQLEFVDHDDFDDERDDRLGHWLRLGRDFFPDSGWDLTATTDLRRYAGETAFSLGLYLQRSF